MTIPGVNPKLNRRLLIFPSGNGAHGNEFLSVYLESADPEARPTGWAISVHGSIAVLSQTDNTLRFDKTMAHTFDAAANDWGFTQFVSLAELNDPAKGFIVDDAVVMHCEVNVVRSFTRHPDDAREKTGFIGLKSQGETSCMNSLLQSLFHVPYFREAVYHMPTTESDSPNNTAPLALQRLFHKMLNNKKAVSTAALALSLGLDTDHSFIQHDVQVRKDQCLMCMSNGNPFGHGRTVSHHQPN
jgi:ubiquitin carboxyl-terminal hydrolase 7